MGIRVPGTGGQYEKVVEGLMQVEKMPIEAAKKRREKVVDEKKEVEKLQTMLAELDGSLNGLKTKSDFYKLKVESSHPDIMEGTISSIAQLGTYEFEVRGLAKAEKELAYGFPDKDKTEVGFGYMMIEREDMEPADITIEPGSTLDQVAQQINDAEIGVRAMVINTKYNPDSYRLLVVSDKSGKESKISIDEDTTFLEFKEQVTGRGLDVLFEDVPVTDDDNILDELVEGVNFNVKRAEPGTRVQMTVTYDMDATIEGIRAFVEKYNSISQFAAEQSKNPKEGDVGKLAGDGSVKTNMRQLQSALFPTANMPTKFTTLAQIGITTNPKTGELTMDDAKVKAALTEDYDGVAQLFIRSKNAEGVADRLSGRLKSFRDPGAGVIRSRLRGLENVIQNQDKDIARRERQLEDKEVSIKRRFSALESQVNGLNAQGSFLQQRFGGGDGGGGGGGNK
jgi:flagellar hook-associated protein 2